MCLGRVHPFKRVFLIAASLIVFKFKPTPLAGTGSFMTIACVQLYYLARK